jgi:hypothetical protein
MPAFDIGRLSSRSLVSYSAPPRFFSSFLHSSPTLRVDAFSSHANFHIFPSFSCCFIASASLGIVPLHLPISIDK